VTMQLFVRDPLTMIAAPVQCDVDGIPKGSHDSGVSPIGWTGNYALYRADRLLVRTSVRMPLEAPPNALLGGALSNPSILSVALRNNELLCRFVSRTHQRDEVFVLFGHGWSAQLIAFAVFNCSFPPCDAFRKHWRMADSALLGLPPIAHFKQSQGVARCESEASGKMSGSGRCLRYEPIREQRLERFGLRRNEADSLRPFRRPIFFRHWRGRILRAVAKRGTLWRGGESN
jgi:hypothetical protein